MEELKGFVKCAHCGGTGTCKNGETETSCLVCKKAHKVNSAGNTSGLVCSVCCGYGVAEPKSARMQNRIIPMLAIIIVYFALFLIFMLARTDNFSEVLAFAATLIGSITGYYFGGKSKTGA